MPAARGRGDIDPGVADHQRLLGRDARPLDEGLQRARRGLAAVRGVAADGGVDERGEAERLEDDVGRLLRLVGQHRDAAMAVQMGASCSATPSYSVVVAVSRWS